LSGCLELEEHQEKVRFLGKTVTLQEESLLGLKEINSIFKVVLILNNGVAEGGAMPYFGSISPVNIREQLRVN
jgi:hypothetical protein